jgi:hypothetical protein
VDEHRYRTASIGELERPDGWSPLRRALDVQAFGVNAWTAHAPGEQVIVEHTEVPAGHEELYVVVAGRATFTVDGDKVDAPAGTAVFVPGGEPVRGAVAAEADTVVLTVGATRGEAFRPRSWETHRDVLPAFDSGDYEDARRLLLEALAQYDDKAELQYNLACAEAQLGALDAALGYLRLAIAGRPGFAELARSDDDLAPLRDDPRFAEIAGA